MKPHARDEGYRFVEYSGNMPGVAIFENLNNFCRLEVWRSCPNHASYGFHYNNTDWEFVREAFPIREVHNNDLYKPVRIICNNSLTGVKK